MSDKAIVVLKVPEMDCQSCAGNVSDALERLGAEAETLPTAGRVKVWYDPAELDETKVVEAVEDAGYEVSDTDEDRLRAPTEVWTSWRATKTYAGGVFLALGLALEFVLGYDPVVLEAFRVFTVVDLLYLAGTAAAGQAVLREGYYAARRTSLDIAFLMSIAIIGAIAVDYYVEAAALAFLFSLAELLESYSVEDARDSVRELMELSPETATVLRDGGEEVVPADELVVGDLVAVRPGERIPADGVVRRGETAVDQSPITGESVPVDKAEGDEVFAGTVNESGYVEVEVTKSVSESTLSRVIRMVEEAEASKTEREKFVDRFASYYTPAVVALAVLTASVPPLLGASFETWFVRGLTLLVISCPCAFVISTPVSVVSAVSSAAKNGVLVKGGRYLETTGEVDIVAVDKTGTLTEGVLRVTDLVPARDDTDADELLAVASAVESMSEHPIATAVVDEAADRGVETPSATGFETTAGVGVSAEVEGRGRCRVGKPESFDAHPDAVERLRGEGKTAVVVADEDGVIGVIGVADTVREEAPETVAALQSLGARVVMLTGDNEGAARAVAEETGVDGYRASLLPDEKTDAVEELREDGVVMMVGDGVNDAPALTAADVGVAMGAAGTDTALETADVALMADDLSKLPYLLRLSRKSNGVIRENIYASLGVKFALAAGVPFGYVSVVAAVLIGDMGMTLGVTGNAMRLTRERP